MDNDYTRTEGDLYNDYVRPPVQQVHTINPLGCRDQIVLGPETCVYS